MAVTHQGITAATVESGRVLDVDINTYTLAVSTQYSKKPQTGVTWASPYTHFVNGEGVYMMPEVGSLCWICFPSDGNRPFVLGWAPAGDEGDYRARRQDMNPGDIYLGTRDENFIWLRRGGVVQIGGGALCQRMFIPVNNTIKDFCENYSLQTLGGELKWSIEREETTTDGHRPALFSVKAREFADDPNPIAEVLVGSHGSGDETILSFLVRASGQNGAAQKVSLKIGKDGKVVWTVESDVTWTVKGKYTIQAEQDVTIKSTSGKVDISGGSTVDVTGQTGVTIKAVGGTVTIEGAPLIQMKQKVLVGNSPQPVALAVPLLTWLAIHVHNLITPIPGTPTGPPLVPPPVSAITSLSLLASMS